jgi:beta-lactam-binding protein with PASTA domain
MTGAFKHDATNTTSIKTADSRLAQAFCDGRAGLIAGANTNPHTSGDELYTAYEAGYAATTPEGLQDGCALAIPITMPDLADMTIADASTAITDAGLVVGKITGSFGVVKTQLPAAAAKTQPGDTVTFTAKVAIPDLAGMTIAAADAALIAGHLISGTVTGAYGVVTSQTPAAAALAVSGASVAYTVKVTVPDLTGMTSANAEAALIAAHLIKGVVTGSSGVVTVQLPLAAALAVSGSAVAYTIA